MKPRCLKPRVALSLLVVLSAGCRAADPPDEGMSSDSTALAALDSAVVEEEPFEEFDDNALPFLPGEGEPREYRLLLVNRADRAAHVFASAGAARVVLDTVPGADSVLVDIRLRADHVDLEAEDDTGRVLSTTSIDLVQTVINRWEILAEGAGRVAVLRSRGPRDGTILETSDARPSVGRRSR